MKVLAAEVLAELTRLGAGWPLALSLAAAVVGQGLIAGRRRTALNEALHELRRPLQALVLAAPTAGPRRGRGGDLPRQTALALERLDREINGGSQPRSLATVTVATLLEAALARCRWRAPLGTATVSLRSPVPDIAIGVDRFELDQALDNLIINAIEHGGVEIVVGGELGEGVVRVTVRDSGDKPQVRRRRLRPAAVLADLAGRRRHGHGLRVVRRVAAAHGGSFRLCRFADRTEAILELPLSGAEALA